MSQTGLDALFNAQGNVLRIAGGEPLVRAGDPSANLYRLEAGRIAAVDDDGDGVGAVLAIHRPGAIIGGAEILSGDLHGATLTTLRDSELSVVSRERLEPLLRSDTQLLSELVRHSLARLREPRATAVRRASILGFVAVCDSVAMRSMVERLAARMRAHGCTVAVIGAPSSEASSSYLSNLESRHDFVLMAAERQDFEFAQYCGRQIDRLLLVGSAHSPLPEEPVRFAATAIRRHRLLDFILIQPADTVRPRDSARWLTAAAASRLFHVRQGDVRDLDRLARMILGRSTAVVFSGGGARAYAHIGVLRALGELGIEADVLAGTSMGAVIAAGVAMGWTRDELDRRIRDAFVNSSPLSDIAFPFLAMTHGREVEARLEAHFGDTTISDLWRPFTCVSTDLTGGKAFVHRHGVLRQALRASISLPGILPPVVIDGRVHVDGALVANLPVELIRDQHDGRTIAVDVAGVSGLRPEELALKPSGLRWLTSGAWLRGPPIVSVLIRSATLPSAQDAVADPRAARDVTIIPDLGNVQLQDWRAYDAAVDAGYKATMQNSGAIAGDWA